MIYIINDIIQGLKAVEYSIPNVNIKDFYNIKKIICPQIAVSESPSNIGVYIDNQPAIVQNIFSIEVYAKDISLPSLMNKKEVAFTILKQVDDYLNKEYGLTMNEGIQAAPYEDQTVFRAISRYIAYIDTRTNSIYRRINTSQGR